MMDHNLTSNNIRFFLDSSKDITELISQYQINPKKTSLDCRSIIVNAFSPQVTVSCSPEVDIIAENFGFPSFFQLLKPFGDKVINQFQIKDSQLISRTTEDFSLRFTRPLNELVSVQQAQINHSSRDNSMSNKQSPIQLFSYQSLELLIDEYIQSITDRVSHEEQAGNDHLVKILKDSIYIKFFTKLMSSSYITPFETMNHPVASFLIITANNTLEDARQKLMDLRQSNVPSYMNIDDILPLMIIVHDETDTTQEKIAYELRESIKKELNVDVFVLGIIIDFDSAKVNSKPEDFKRLNPPVLTSIEDELQTTHLPHGESKELPLSNIRTIYRLLKEIIQKKIIPFMEKKISIWDTEVVIPRKSLSGRFFSVSKRYFGNSNNSIGKSDGSSHTYDPISSSYPPKSNEMIIRKLADWSFMIRDYRYAYTTYELIKKDFLSDKAWAHLASVQEMAAISLLMGATNITSKLKKDIIDPLLDDSNYTYLSRCGLKTYALRSVIIVSELFCNLKDDWMSSPSAIKWLRKAIDDKLVGRLGKCLVTDRIGYVYGLYVESRARVIMNRKLITVVAEEEKEADKEVNPYKLHRSDMATIGLTRNRKSAFWKLLAAKEWDPSSKPLQVKLILNEVAPNYQGFIFAETQGSLYEKLHRMTTERLQKN